jgi:adenylate cyclase
MLWKRLLVNTLIGLGVGGTMAAINQTDLARKVELSLYNTRFENFRGLRPPSKDILILSIDEASLEEVGVFPWKRTAYADVISKLHKYGAKMVAFDIMFATPSDFPDADMLFEKALLAHPTSTLIGSKFDFGSTARISGSGTDQEGDGPLEAASYTPPVFEESAKFGFTNFPEDVDGQIRRAQMVLDIKSQDLLPTPMTLQDQYEPSFAFAMLQQLDPPKADALLKQYQDKHLWINYAGPPQSYKTLSFYILAKLDRPGFGRNEFSKLTGQRPEDYFKDKIVMVGATAEALQDNKNTPFVSQSNTKMPGVEVHAAFFDTLRQNIPYRPADNATNLAIVLAAGVATAILLALLKPLGGLALILLLAAAYSVVNIYFFHIHRLSLDWFAPVVALGLCYTATYAYRFLIEEREKRRIRRFFKSYVSPKLVEELLKDPKTTPSLKSERRMVSMLFSDIAGFTSMSESLPPDEVEHILNEYLTAMTEIVFENEGTLDKYIGDAVMAVWGNVGPSNPKTDAYKCVNTAVQMQRKLSELREKWLSEGMVPLQIRIGMNTGEALVGNFGSPQKMDYTVIGDAVNTAARLEGLNKEFGSSILISQSTYDLVSDRINARHCGSVKVKGKEEPVSVYEVVGWKDEGAAATEVRSTKWIKGSNETQWK